MLTSSFFARLWTSVTTFNYSNNFTLLPQLRTGSTGTPVCGVTAPAAQRMSCDLLAVLLNKGEGRFHLRT